MEDTDGDLLSHNFRPVQPIGDRIVWLTSDNFLHDDNDLHDKIHGKKKKKVKNTAAVMGTDIVVSLVSIVFITSSHMFNNN